MTNETLVCITSTYNSADIIEPYLVHLVNLGIDTIVVSEYGSTDGTRETLRDPRWKNRVRVFDVPLQETAQCTNDRLRWVRQEIGAGWCILCDPDEFLQAPQEGLKSVLAHCLRQGHHTISIPRFNMTAPRSSALAGKVEKDFLASMQLRIVAKHVRRHEEFAHERLSPPWIFTNILDKVAFRIESEGAVDHGDHAITQDDADANKPCTNHGLYMLHYPIRSWQQFVEKVEMAKESFDSNDQYADLGPAFLWHWRRWIRMMDQNHLRDEYLDQFIDDKMLPTLLADGILEDMSVASTLRSPT